MRSGPGSNRLSRARRQQGFVLIIGLLFLVVLTLLSLSMFRSFNLQESIAGNTREKQRTFEAAQSALAYGEWWLGLGGGNVSECAGINNASDITKMRVCSQPLIDPRALPWVIRTDYQPPSMSVKLNGGIATGGDINYNAMPGLHISYMGVNAANSQSLVYQVSGFGYGGSSTAATVVQSTYELSNPHKPLDQP
jgi:type IV pilus assembly protein PilX